MALPSAFSQVWKPCSPLSSSQPQNKPWAGQAGAATSTFIWELILLSFGKTGNETLPSEAKLSLSGNLLREQDKGAAENLLSSSKGIFQDHQRTSAHLWSQGHETNPALARQEQGNTFVSRQWLFTLGNARITFLLANNTTRKLFQCSWEWGELLGPVYTCCSSTICNSASSTVKSIWVWMTEFNSGGSKRSSSVGKCGHGPGERAVLHEGSSGIPVGGALPSASRAHPGGTCTQRNSLA